MGHHTSAHHTRAYTHFGARGDRYCHGDIHVYNDYKKMLDTDDTYEGDLGAYMALKQCGFSATGENHNMSWFVPCMVRTGLRWAYEGTQVGFVR